MNVVLVTRNSGIRQLHKLFLEPHHEIRVGRSWQNDIVIDDSYIDASHLIIQMDADGNILVSDLSTRNGTQINNRSIDSVSYDLGTPIRAGDTILVIENADKPVAPALSRDFVAGLTRRFSTVYGLLLVTLMASAGILLDVFVLSGSEASSEIITDNVTGILAIIFCWSLLAGIIGKLFRNQMQFLRHWVFACLLFFLFSSSVFFINVATFNLDSTFATVWMEKLNYSVFVMLLAYGLLSLATQTSKGKRVAASTLLAVLPLCYSVVIPLLQEDVDRWSEVARSGQVNQIPAFLLITPKTLDAHFAATESLFASLAADVDQLESETRESGEYASPVVISENR